MKYDFIEIGTSDFETLIQSANGQIGMSIEPMKMYLDNLPDKDTVIKLNCAISNVDADIDVWWIDPPDINKFNLPDWIRGCSSVLKPHQLVLSELQNRGLEYIYKKSSVKCLSWKTLVENYDIKRVDYLKIDTEGHDYVIVNAILDYGAVFPCTIYFECNYLTPKEEVERLADRLRNSGYDITEWTHHDMLVKQRKKI